jgi:hypothetical protein
VVGLGRLLAEGDAEALAELRAHAGDERWRVREAVAMGLQRWGREDFDGLAAAMAEWASGSWLERRAAAAALCEPVLLTDAGRVRATLGVLEAATGPVEAAGTEERRSEAFKAFRKGLGYCWSVAVAAAPEVGWPAFEAVVERAPRAATETCAGSRARTCASGGSSGWTPAGSPTSLRGSAENVSRRRCADDRSRAGR